MITGTRRLRRNRQVCLIAMQAQIDDLDARWSAITDGLRNMYYSAGGPSPDALRPQPRDRHGLRVVQPEGDGAA
jgi:hypothetical protein